MTLKNPLPASSQRENISPGEPLSVVSICLDKQTWSLLKQFSESTPMVKLQRQLNDYLGEQEAVSEYIGNPPPDICLLDVDNDRRNAAVVAERIHAETPETAIFAVSSQSQPDFIIQAMRSGCSEYLLKPLDPEQMLNAVARVAGRRRERKDTSEALVLGFLGAKGGCGVTTLVTQLGALLAKGCSRKTLVLDLHPDIGDAALYLRLTKYKYHSFELLQNTHRLDGELLQSFVLQHSSGVEVIPSPEGADPIHNLGAGAVEQTVDFLRLRYEFILVDLPPILTGEIVEAIRRCDQIYLVTVAEVAALRNLVRQFQFLTQKEVPLDRVRVVLNRHQKRALISDEQIEKAIRQKIFWKVPNEYAHVVKTIHGGDPIAHLSSSDVTRNLSGLARAIGTKPGSEEKKKDNVGILGLWNR